jgi:hypothetical protein
MQKRKLELSDYGVAQAGAQAFAADWLSKHSLHLPSGLDDAVFGEIMTAVTQGLCSAYATGYIDARGKK